MRIDAHQHFWQLKRGDYDWLRPDLVPLYRDYLPDDLRPVIDSHNIDRTILVQAAASTKESEFLLKLSDDNSFIGGVVGWVDLESADCIPTLETLSRHSRFVGIRPMIQDMADPDWMLRPSLDPAFRFLSSRGLVFDALVRPVHLQNLLSLTDRYPELPVVIDHAAKPDIAAGGRSGWSDDLVEIARSTTANCKLSGLVTEAGDQVSIEAIRPYVDVILDAFGPERIMWGSDWPVLKLAAEYDEWVAMTEALLAGANDAARDRIWGGTACEFYSIQ